MCITYCVSCIRGEAAKLDLMELAGVSYLVGAAELCIFSLLPSKPKGASLFYLRYNQTNMRKLKTKKTLHAIIWKEDTLFVAKFLELELASQGKTKKEALTNLKEALDLYLEDEPLKKFYLPKIEKVDTQLVNL